MYPIFLKLGFFDIPSYGLMIAISFLVATSLFLKKALLNSNYNKIILENLIFGLFISAIIGARTFYVLMDFSYYLSNPLSIVKVWQGGLVYWGGFIGAIIYSYFYLRKNNLDFFPLADIMSPYLALAHAIGRLGCFVAGCCYGRPTGHFFGVIFKHPESLAPLSQALHPTQLYEFLGNILLFFILLKILAIKKIKIKNDALQKHGQVFAIYLIFYPILRFIVEFFRGDDRGSLLGLTATQLASTVAFLAGMILLYYLKHEQE
ncbi:MAG: prolipoprotein diacylglyceryl transferase [Bacteroidetes bacterium]|nr:prolipoprotein diacylglyceryl transferase [Bacteroidota bacterium]